MSDVAPAAGTADALWQRVAPLRFRLQDSVAVDPLNYRGDRWYLLRNAFNRQQLRLNERLYALVERFDGRRTLAEVVAGSSGAATAEGGQGRQELLGALTQLQAAGMLSSDAPADVRVLLAQRRQLDRRRRWSRWVRLLSPRLPLFAPDAFLGRSLTLVAWMLHPLVLAGGLLLIGLAAVQALMQWDALAVYGAQRLDDPRQWLLIVCLYPLVKALHELGHGIVARAYGAEVNEMGITLLVFLPVPYVDATAASAFASKYRRMLVGAAGILVELLLAALALFAWQGLGDGLMREAAFAVMLIGGVSTLLFNGNPLLRFDGYYILCDAIEIPNLASRSARFYGYLARRYLLGMRGERPPSAARGEPGWFLFYGAASTLYRLAITVAIALFLVASIPALGVLLAGWLLGVQLFLPLLRQLRFIAADPRLAGQRRRAFLRVALPLSGLLALLVLLPMPSSTRVEGIILLPEQAAVRAEVEGFLDARLVANDMPVARGDVLFRLRNPQLDTDVAVLEARLRELEARRDGLGFEQRVAREIEAERIAEAREELAELRARQRGLLVRSPGEGVLQLTVDADQRGRFVQQGEMLAYLGLPDHAVVRAVADERDAERIRAGSKAVEVRLADREGDTLPGELLGEVPLGSETLPSAALGSRAGGRIPVDARDPRGLTALEPVFTFDVSVPATGASEYVGGRAYLRFAHAPSPLLARWYDAARRRLLDEIGE